MQTYAGQTLASCQGTRTLATHTQNGANYPLQATGVMRLKWSAQLWRITTSISTFHVGPESEAMFTW